jgi:hypothetical protein
MSFRFPLLFLMVFTGCARYVPPELVLVSQHPTPLLKRGVPGTESNKYGFEGGRVVRLGDTFHLFISEMDGDPRWTKTRLAHWTSADRLTWTRVSTLYESTGEFKGHDRRAALFLPIPIYDTELDRWTLFYSAFRSAPNVPGRWLINHDGRIHRALSRDPGPAGIAGPYADENIVLEPGPDSDAWEGLQGVDSFFPFRAGDRWLAFYGSAHTQNWPANFWGVGLAESKTLAGPWRRLSDRNPVLIDNRWVENLHVHQLPDRSYIAVFDAGKDHPAIGYTTSPDGLNWTPARYITLSKGENNWIKQTRTPLGLIPRDDGDFDCFFTAYDTTNYGCLSHVVLRVVRPQSQPTTP